MKKLLLLAILTLGGYALIGTGPRPSPGPIDPGAPPTVPVDIHRTGFYGQALLFCSPVIIEGLQGDPIRTFISVYDTNGNLVKRVVSNLVGQFYTNIRPGSYTLVPTLRGQRLPPRILSQYNPPVTGTIAPNVNVTVSTNQFTPVEVSYSCDAI